MSDILSLILEAKRKRVEVLKKNREGVLSLVKKAPKIRPFKEAIDRNNKISLIAEVKQASPSAGILRKEFSLPELVKKFKKMKVNALSVLTEEEFFLGKLSYLEEIKKEISIPILRKDFIFDEIQVLESRAAGADAILLIVRILSDEVFHRLYNLAKELGMDVLVEIHNEKELKRVLSFSVEIIGINNRNLSTLKVDLTRTEKLVPFISQDVVIVSESGISTVKDMLWLKGLGVSAVLIGEAIMKAEDCEAKIRELHIDA